MTAVLDLDARLKTLTAQEILTRLANCGGDTADKDDLKVRGYAAQMAWQEKHAGVTPESAIRRLLEPWLEKGWIAEHDGSYSITDEGRIIAGLFKDAE
jgi:hypothetical protein